MWHWDQGHLAYFQFDALRQLATVVGRVDLKQADRATLSAATGLPFAAPATYSPWRNYSRALRLALLVSETRGVAQPTPVADVLSHPGAVTCDEYMHFLARATTDPSPALKNWRRNARYRYPLLFALKYLLTKAAIAQTVPASATVDEIIGAYRRTGLDGTEDQGKFLDVAMSTLDYAGIGKKTQIDARRQARESLLVLSQISYLHVSRSRIVVSLHPDDALAVFNDLQPIIGPVARNPEAEIRRLAALFKDGSTSIIFDYPKTSTDDVVESGFREGNKVKKTHITIERNVGLRIQFFAVRSSPVCDFCALHTAKSYPWTERVLDIHHLLPLCSGTHVKVKERSTTLDDLVPVCPNCHRAIHRYYDGWLSTRKRADFTSATEAKTVYAEAKRAFPGLMHG